MLGDQRRWAFATWRDPIRRNRRWETIIRVLLDKRHQSRLSEVEIIDNINHLLGDSLKQTIKPGAKLKIAASCFSIYAFEALKAELEQVESLQFIFTSPTFVPHEVSDHLKKEHREFHIPKLERERSLYGSEFEVRLRNELTQRAIAKECAAWMQRKARFRSNRGRAPMQQFAAVRGEEGAGRAISSQNSHDKTGQEARRKWSFMVEEAGFCVSHNPLIINPFPTRFEARPWLRLPPPPLYRGNHPRGARAPYGACGERERRGPSPH